MGQRLGDGLRAWVAVAAISLSGAASATGQSVRRPPPDPAPPALVVDVVDSLTYRGETPLDPRALPLIFHDPRRGSRQLRDLALWRERLVELARARTAKHARMGPRRYLSRLRLKIRCDAGQLWGWVPTILEAASRTQGSAFLEEVNGSPLIAVAELQILGTGRSVTVRMITPPEASKCTAAVDLRVPSDAASRAAIERPVDVRLAGIRTPVGRFSGWAPHSERTGHVSLQMAPASMLLAVRTYCRGVDARGRLRRGLLTAGPRVPFLYGIELLEAMRDCDCTLLNVGPLAGEDRVKLVAGRMTTESGAAFVAAEGRRLGTREVGASVKSGDAIGFPYGDPLVDVVSSTTERTPPRLFRGRGSRRNLRARGGGGRTQRTVSLSLSFLAGRQHPLGAVIGENGIEDIVGTALLAQLLVATGRDPADRTTGRGLSQALDMLIRDQRGGTWHRRRGPVSDADHATLTRTLVEVYGTHGTVAARGPAELAVQHIVRKLRPDRTWGDGTEPDLELTARMATVLELAYAAELPFVTDELMVEVREALRLWSDARGSAATPNVAAQLAFARVLGGEDPSVTPFIKEAAARIGRALATGRDLDATTWESGVALLFQCGGEPWSQVQGPLRAVAGQQVFAPATSSGSWRIKHDGADASDVRAAARMGLAFTVYYRYDRLFEPPARSGGQRGRK